MAHIQLRTDAFAGARRSAGYASDYSLARAMQLSRSTVARVLAGEIRPGAAFVAGALIALPDKFEDLFEVQP